FPKVKTDAKGRMLGRDGKPLRLLSGRTNRPLSAADQREIRRVLHPGVGTEEMVRVLRRIGPIRTSEVASVTDAYAEADALSRLRGQAKDWADGCRVVVGLIREQALRGDAPRDQGGAGQAEGTSADEWVWAPDGNGYQVAGLGERGHLAKLKGLAMIEK